MDYNNDFTAGNHKIQSHLTQVYWAPRASLNAASGPHQTCYVYYPVIYYSKLPSGVKANKYTFTILSQNLGITLYFFLWQHEQAIWKWWMLHYKSNRKSWPKEAQLSFIILMWSLPLPFFPPLSLSLHLKIFQCPPFIFHSRPHQP